MPKIISEVKYDIPYVPTGPDRLEKMMELAKVQPREFVADLGCGDGRVIVSMARQGAFAYGFEIDPGRTDLAKSNVVKAGLEENAFVYNLNFWSVDLSPFDLITLYGITSIMNRLEKKLEKELRPGSRVVSNYFIFPTWTHEKQVDNVYLYVKK